MNHCYSKGERHFQYQTAEATNFMGSSIVDDTLSYWQSNNRGKFLCICKSHSSTYIISLLCGILPNV